MKNSKTGKYLSMIRHNLYHKNNGYKGFKPKITWRPENYILKFLQLLYSNIK